MIYPRQIMEFYKKHGLLPTLGLFSLYVAFTYLSSSSSSQINNSNQTQENNNNQTQEQSVIINSANPNQSTAPVSNCPTTQFVDGQNQWDTKDYKGPDDDGFFVAKKGPQPFPVMWYKSTIPSAPGVWELKYRVDGDIETKETTPFFFVFGKPLLFRFFAHETEPNQVALEWFDQFSTQPIKRERFSLPEPVKEGKPMIVVIKSESWGNSANLTIKVDYIGQSGSSRHGEFTASVLVPEPRTRDYMVNIGFGVPIGYKINPISFSICSI